jgi:hypothetical protein
MNSIVIRKAVIFICIAFATNTSEAQSSIPKYEFGIMGGAFIYQGDLAPSDAGSYQFLKPSWQIFVSKIWNENFSARINIARGSINGDDARYATPAWRQTRNFNFNTTITEISGSLVCNFPRYNSDGTTKKLATYVFGGAGISILNVQRDWSKLNTASLDPKSSLLAGLAIDTAHSTPKVIPVIPLGAGIRYAVTHNLSVAAEFTYRLTFTDYLDGFSKSADPAKKDFYYGYSVGLIYSLFNDGIKCPKVKR